MGLVCHFLGDNIAADNNSSEVRLRGSAEQAVATTGSLAKTRLSPDRLPDGKGKHIELCLPLVP
jgi:hypothetical protein